MYYNDPIGNTVHKIWLVVNSNVLGQCCVYVFNIISSLTYISDITIYTEYKAEVRVNI